MKTYKKPNEISVKKSFDVGGGSPSYPTVLADNLRSDDYMEVIIGVSEGPINGLEDGAKSIYLDDTPIVSQSGTVNYSDYETNLILGDPNNPETIYPKLGGLTAGAVSVNSNLTGYDSDDPYDSPDYNNDELTRVIIAETTRHDFDWVDLKLAVNQLSWNDDEGNSLNGTIQLDVKWQEIGASRWEQIPHERTRVSGHTSSTYIAEWRLFMPPTGLNKNIRIRIAVVGDKSGTSTGTIYNISFASYEMGFSKNLTFDSTAALQVVLKSTDRLSSQPQISAIYKLLEIKIPSNYNPETHTYDGDWDGTFNVAWTDNPAWILYDYLTNTRYGLNAFYPFDVDKYDFYDVGKFCDEMVPDGAGGVEPRYTFNCIFDTKVTGREIADDIAASIHSMLYQDGTGTVRCTVLRDDQQATHVFSEENVIDGLFSYSFTDPSDRFNSISVDFVNSEESWIEDSREVRDDEHIAKYGENGNTLKLKGCIKESQALRLAWYALLSCTTETMNVSFGTGRAGLNVTPNDVILISDPNMGYAQSGRLTGVDQTRKTLSLRDPIFIEAGAYVGDIIYYADIQVGEQIQTYQLEIEEVGYVKTLKTTLPVDANVDRSSLFTIRTSELTTAGQPKPFRVLAVSEDETGERVAITAIEINRSKQYQADNLVKLCDATYESLPESNLIPQILGLDFSEYYNKDDKTAYLYMSPKLDSSYPYYKPNAYRVYYRYFGELAWNEINYTAAITIKDPPMGAIEWTVLPISRLGQSPDLSQATAYRFDTYDITKPPANVVGVSVDNGLASSRITWTPVDDPDIICYEVREVADGQSWEDGTVLTYATTNCEYTYIFTEVKTVKLMIKAKDVIGLYSTYPAIAYAEPKAPDSVKEFYVTLNNDNTRFDWVAETDVNVEYEVRAGNSDWGSATMLFKSKSLNNTILNPVEGYTGFFIKAVSSLGRYSEKATYSELNCALKVDRNIVYKYDAPEHQWAGIMSGFVKTENNQSIIMDDEKFGGYFAEYYFKVNFDDTVRARNWLETEAFKYNNSLTFADLEYSWNSLEAQNTSWLNSSGLSASEGQCIPVISWADPTHYFHDIGFALNGTLYDVKHQVTATISSSVEYGPNRCDTALNLNRKVDVKYENVNFEREFTFRFTLKFTFESVDFYRVLRLVTDSGDYCDVQVIRNDLVVKWSDGVTQIIQFERFRNYDFVFISISQSEGGLGEPGIRRVRCAVEKANNSYENETFADPIGQFSKLWIGSRY